MEDGGHITGWLVEGKDVDEFNKALTEYTATVGEKYTPASRAPRWSSPSATATTSGYREELLRRAEKRTTPASICRTIRRAMRSSSWKTSTTRRRSSSLSTASSSRPSRRSCLQRLKRPAQAQRASRSKWYAGEESGTIVLDKNKGELAVGILQHFLDDYLKEKCGRDRLYP